MLQIPIIVTNLAVTIVGGSFSSVSTPASISRKRYVPTPWGGDFRQGNSFKLNIQHVINLQPCKYNIDGMKLA